MNHFMVQRTAPACDTVSLRFRTERFQQVTAQVAFWTACGSAVSILFSIAASQILLGIAILCFLVARTTIRLPRPWLPLALFLLGTIISLLASDDPRIGMPQVRKLYVYLILVFYFPSSATS